MAARVERGIGRRDFGSDGAEEGVLTDLLVRFSVNRSGRI